MESLMEFIGTETFLLVLFAMIILLLIGYAIIGVKLSRLNRRYQDFMRKLGNGKNLEEDLQNYMSRVNQVEKQNAKISNQIKMLNGDLIKCIQKVGIVRYSAFRDTGSDLSFALALLDENNDGVVLNGIYSREMSNIYAKPVQKGKSTYTISEEEMQAIEKAMDSSV